MRNILISDIIMGSCFAVAENAAHKIQGVGHQSLILSEYSREDLEKSIILHFAEIEKRYGQRLLSYAVTYDVTKIYNTREDKVVKRALYSMTDRKIYNDYGKVVSVDVWNPETNKYDIMVPLPIDVPHFVYQEVKDHHAGSPYFFAEGITEEQVRPYYGIYSEMSGYPPNPYFVYPGQFVVHERTGYGAFFIKISGGTD